MGRWRRGIYGGTAGAGGIYVEDWTGTSSTIALPSGALQPDIALANTVPIPNGPILYQVVVTFVDKTGKLYIQIYNLQNVGTNSGWVSLLPGTLLTPTLWYQINSSTTPLASQISKNLAMSNCSNTGHDILSCWYDNGLGSIIYKHSTPDVMAFKTTGVLNPNVSNEVKIFPNPASDVIHLQGVPASTNYVIQNTSGQTEVMGSFIGGNTIDLHAIANGNYIIRLVSAGKVQSQKFTKQ